LIIRALLLISVFSSLAIFAGVRFSLLLGLGLLIGFCLERSGFGFAGPWRRFILDRDGRGIMAQLLAIGLTAIAIQPLIASAPGTLIGAIAPISISMIAAAAIFGFAMQLIIGCGSGTLVNAGSGNLLAIIALPLFCVGSFLGTLLMPIAVEATPHILLSLPVLAGLTGSLAWTLFGLLGIGFLVSRYSKGPLWNKRFLIAAIILAVLASLHVLVAGQPWGVVYGLGLWVAKGVQAGGLNVADSAFWSHPINAQALRGSILTDTTSLTSLGLIGGSALAAWRISKGMPLIPVIAPWYLLVAAGAGLLLGISSRLAFGCNVGALFSGIASGSIHGWVWLVAGFGGSVAGVSVREWLWRKATMGVQ
jgi:hypothetical protein